MSADKKVVINSSWKKRIFSLIVLQIQCNGPNFKNTHDANQSSNDRSRLCTSLFFYHISLTGYNLARTHRHIHTDTEREGDTQSLAVLEKLLFCCWNCCNYCTRCLLFHNFCASLIHQPHVHFRTKGRHTLSF